MKIRKCFKHSFEMVLHSKLRSWLTILGVVIGVASVIAIMSIGTGLQRSVSNQLTGLGADILTISPGFSRGGGSFGRSGPDSASGSSSNNAASSNPILKKSDVQTLKGIPEILMLDTQIRGNVNVSYLGKSGKVSMTGVDQSTWSKITTVTIREGRFLDSADQNVIVIGARLADSFFRQPLGINKMMTIEGSSYRIVGILNDETNNIYMPIQIASQLITDKTTDQYDSIIIKIKDADNLNDTMNKITAKLISSRHVTASTQDFSLISSQQIQQRITSTISSMSAFLIALAAVSLIVGAVGIANTMFTSVLEKTKEIGIMKAIGARNRDIMLIFIFNAALIGLVGGILGILLGMFLSGLLPALLGGLPLGRGGAVTYVTLNSIILALSVSTIVGIIAGLIPAYQASKLRPVDALRYE